MTRAERDWAEMVRSVDRVTAAAAAHDLDARRITIEEVARGFSELAKLQGGEEPDYNARGLGTAYLLYYLARRALNTADACLSLGEISGDVRVLDLGAGTNAGALALATAFPGAHFDIVAVEPSAEMADAGSFASANLQNLSLRPVQALLDDVLDQEALAGETFDLLVMSALLPYGWRKKTVIERVEFGERLLQRMRPGGRLLVIEPRAKLAELESLERCLERAGIEHWLGETNISAEDDQLLPACSELFRLWYPGVLRSPQLSRDAREMLSGVNWFGLRAGSVRPDVLLSGVRRIGPVRIEPVYPPVVRMTILSSAREIIAAPTARAAGSMPSWARQAMLVGAMAAVAAIAFGVFALV